MKLPCEMIQDLLPLYHDDVCSDISKTLVQDHLSYCESCRSYLASLDADLDVPELEMEKAEPLVKIQVNWKKRTRREKLKSVICGIGSFIIMFAFWWTLTQWCIVPLNANDYVIKEAAQLENGMIHIEFTLMYDKATPETGITEDGVLFENYRRPILAARRDYVSSGSAGVYLDPNDLTWFDLGSYSAYCLGDPASENSVIIWKLGMDMPSASQNTEEEFKNLQEAYAAPNAPETPDIISVIKMEPTVDWHESSNVKETVVTSTENE